MIRRLDLLRPFSERAYARRHHRGPVRLPIALLETAGVRAAAGRLLAGHDRIVVRDLRLAEQVVVNGDLADGALKEALFGHGADVERAAVGLGHDIVLAHAACLAV